jgi:hypothetical protein
MRNQNNLLLIGAAVLVGVVLYKKYHTQVTAGTGNMVINPAIPTGINSYDPGIIDRTPPQQTVAAPAVIGPALNLTFDNIENL